MIEVIVHFLLHFIDFTHFRCFLNLKLSILLSAPDLIIKISILPSPLFPAR